MRKFLFTILFIGIATALPAQDNFIVKYKGAKPTIRDFAWALANAINDDEEECGDRPTNAILYAMTRQRDGIALEDGESLTIDERNGYLLYEYKYDANEIRMEMCYWNEADGKHKLLAFNNMASMVDGKPLLTETSGLTFWRYSNSTKKLSYVDTPGFEVEYFDTTYALPRVGKDITVTKWHEDGTTTQTTLKWDGRRFGF